MTDTAFHPEDDLSAAEHVSFLREPADRIGFETRLRNDVGFVALVTQWELRFQDMNEDDPEVPAPDLMPMSIARLFPTAAKPGLWANL